MLRLRFCTVKVMDLQALIDATPELTTVQLEYVLLKPPQVQQHRHPELLQHQYTDYVPYTYYTGFTQNYAPEYPQ